MSQIVYRIKETIEVTLEVWIDGDIDQEDGGVQEGLEEADVWAESIVGSVDDSRSGYGSCGDITSRILTKNIEVMNR